MIAALATVPLQDTGDFGYSAAVPKSHTDQSTILYLRGTPREVARKLKAAAALQGTSLTEYVQELLKSHVEDLERKGLLPKGK